MPIDILKYSKEKLNDFNLKIKEVYDSIFVKEDREELDKSVSWSLEYLPEFIITKEYNQILEI